MARRKPLFLCDSMLGKLCRWLRILGFKSVSASDVAEGKNKSGVAKAAEIDDEVLLRECLKLDAVLLTRDEELYQKARNYVKTALIESNFLEEQAAFVIRKFGLTFPKRPREKYCPACGSAVKRIRKRLVKDKVFPRVFERQKFFWQCSACGSLYWKGTHWEKIIEKGMMIGAKLAKLK